MWFSPFRGGVHPDGFKEMSSQLPIKTLPLPKELRIALRQHAGSDAIPIVKVGDYVLKGQLIAKNGPGLSAPIHAPTSGIVSNIMPVVAAHPSGLESTAIVIAVDGKDQAIPNTSNLDPFTLDKKLLSDQIDQAGIVGMGGASFPSAIKLISATKTHIETLIINGGECEPYLTADDRLMRECADDIVLGARLIRYIIDADRAVIAIEDNKTQAIDAMRKATNNVENVDVVVVPTRYPMGSAKQMIQAVIGKEVPAGGRSSDVGVLMHNVATAYAIARALTQGEPLISRIVTVSGGAIKQPQNVEALIGTPLSHFVEHCGGVLAEPDRIILGGPMMGHIMPNLNVPLNKGSGGVLALTRKEISDEGSSPCIRCGRCVDACPMGLVPLEMANHSKHQDFDGAKEYGLKDCILCGSCAYVCPSHIPLVHYFQYAKGELSKQQVENRRADFTRELADSKRERKEKEAQAKAAAKAAKQAKSKKPLKAEAE